MWLERRVWVFLAGVSVLFPLLDGLDGVGEGAEAAVRPSAAVIAVLIRSRTTSRGVSPALSRSRIRVGVPTASASMSPASRTSWVGRTPLSPR